MTDLIVSDDLGNLSDFIPGKELNYLVTAADNIANLIDQAFFSAISPEVLNVYVPDNLIASTTLLITWSTPNVATISKVKYGTTQSYGSTNQVDTARFQKDHAVIINGLSADTLYYFQIECTDSAGRAHRSNNFTVRTKTVSTTHPSLPQNLVDTNMPTTTVTKTVKATGGDYAATVAGFQQALNDAQDGWEIVVDAGVNIIVTGTPISIPNKTGTGWVVVRSSSVDLPDQCNRVAPEHATEMFRISTNSVQAPFVHNTSAHHFRFIGMEVTIEASALSNAPGGSTQSGLIRLDNENGVPSSSRAHHIIFDRCYIHGQPLKNTLRGIFIGGNDIAVIDSHLDEFHSAGADSQAILVGSSDGPFKIVNNFLEAAGENFMCGGLNFTPTNTLPRDFEFRQNEFSWQQSWKRNDPLWDGIDWITKNNFELKAGQRVFLYGNTFHRWWESEQTGGTANLKSSNENTTVQLTGTVQISASSTALQGTGTQFLSELTVGQNITVNFNRDHTYKIASITNNTFATLAFNATATLTGVAAHKIDGSWLEVNDIAIYKNYFYDVGTGLTMSGGGSEPQAADNFSKRWVIQDNLIEIDGIIWDNEDTGFDSSGNATSMFSARIVTNVTNNETQFPDYIVIEHNTFINARGATSNLMLMSDPPADPARKGDGFVFRNNIIGHGSFGLKASGTGIGTASLNACFSGYTFSNNGVIGGTSSSYPSGNVFVTGWTDAKFLNFNSGVHGGDFRLDPSSPFYNVASDSVVRPTTGKHYGADVDAVLLATQGVVSVDSEEFVSDTFTESTDTTLASHLGEIGAVWTKHPAAVYTSTATVDAASDRIFPLGTTAYYASGPPPSADYEVEGVFFAASIISVNAAICARMDVSADTMYYVRLLNGISWELLKRIAGTSTSLGSSSNQLPAVGESRTVKLIVSGSSISVEVNGVTEISVVDSSITSPGRAGVRFAGAASASAGFHLASINASNVESAGLELTVTVSDTANNLADAVTRATAAGLSVSASDTINNWADFIPEKSLVYKGTATEDIANLADDLAKTLANTGVNLMRVLSDDLNNWADFVPNVKLRYDFEIVQQNVNNWADNQASTLASAGGNFIKTGTDSINNWVDQLQIVIQHRLARADSINNLSDSLVKVLGQRILPSETLNNWSDAMTRLATGQMNLSDSVNNWNELFQISGVPFLVLSLSDNGNFLSDQFGRSIGAELPLGTAGNLILTVDGDDLTDRAITEPGSFRVKQEQEVTRGTIVLDFSDGAPLPGKGSHFVVTLPNSLTVELRAQTVSEVTERYHDEVEDYWIHEFTVVDPITVLETEKLPSRKPFIDTNTGAILEYLFTELDPELILNLAPGNDVAAFNLKDFSTFGDVLKSEIMSGGYVVRMQNGLNVFGGFDSFVIANSNWAIDQSDDRYTPTRFTITPSELLIDDVTVSPTKDIPLSRSSEFIEFDPRASKTVPLQNNIFGLEDSEPLKITAGQDISDTTEWEKTGTISMSGSHIGLNGTLVLLDARPFVAPYKVAWTGIIPTTGSTYQFGFQDDLGGWIWSVSGSDFPVNPESGTNLYRYAIFTNPTGPTSFEVWGFELHEDTGVSEDTVISTVAAADYCGNTLSITSPWNIDNQFVRILNNDGDEVGRSRILRLNGSKTVLFVDVLPQGIEPGFEVTRGLDVDQKETVKLIKTVSVSNNRRYGLPAISGSGVNLRAMVIQKTGMIDGYLVSLATPGIDQVYPRGLVIDVDLTEFGDGVISGSGSSGVFTLAEKFSREKQASVILNYMNGGKRDFHSICGVDGAHITVSIDNEQDPVKLQEIAHRICELGSRNIPRVNSNMESTEIAGNPLPWDPIPLDMPPDYRVGVPSVPIISSEFSYEGSRIGSEDEAEADVLLYQIDAGDKSPAERARAEAARGQPITRFPLRVASVGGARITSVDWDDVTLRATISGGGTVFGPRGQSLNLGGGIDPAAEAGIADKHSNPVRLYCTVDGGNFHRDSLIFTVIYPPSVISPESVSSRYSAKRNTVTFAWPKSRGAVVYEIQRIFSSVDAVTDICGATDLIGPESCFQPDPEDEATYFWRTVGYLDARGRASYELPYEPTSKSLRFRPIGLCDKTTDWVEACCNLDPLPAPDPFEVLRIKKNDRVVFRVGAPSQEEKFRGRAEFLRILVRQTTDPGLVVAGREDFPDDDENVRIWNLPLASQDMLSHYFITFEDTAADDIVWVAACWVDRFHEEGELTEPFDATKPPMTVPTISLADFFQSASQANGGTVEDDDDATGKVEYTGQFRIHIGRHNHSIQLVCHKAQKTNDYSTVGTWNYLPGGKYNRNAKSSWHDVTDEDAANGYIDIDMHQEFVDSKKKHFTYRPYKIKAKGPAIRERIGDSGETETEEVLYNVGFAPDLPQQPLVPHTVDAVFDMVPFYFHPGVAGLSPNALVVENVRVKTRDNGFKIRWRAIDDPNIWRYFAFISETNFGVKGPGDFPSLGLIGDPDIADDLNAIAGEGDILLYNQTNTTRNVTAAVIDVSASSGGGVLILNNEDYGSLTIEEGISYFVGVIAQLKNGRFAPVISDTDTDVSGGPGGSAIPGTFNFPTLTENTTDGDPEKNIARVVFTMATTNGLSLDLNNIQGIALRFTERNEANTANVGAQFQDFTAAFGSATSISRQVYLKFGKRYRLDAVIAVNGDKTSGTNGTLDFVAGGIRTVDTGDTKIVPPPSFQSIVNVDNKNDEVTIRVAQDGVDIVWMKKLIIEKSTAGGAFKLEKEVNLKAEDTLYLSNIAFKDFTYTIKRKAAATVQYRAEVVAVGGKHSAQISSGTQGAGGADGGAAVPGALNFPTLVTNTVDGDPEKNLARIIVQMSTSNGQSLDLNNITAVSIRLTERNENNTADVGDFFFVQASATGSAITFNRQFYLKMGRRFRINAVLSYNGDKFTTTTGALDLTAGGLRQVDTGDTKIVPTPTFQSITNIDNKNDLVTIRVAQDGADIVWFKKLIIEKSTAGGTFAFEKELNIKAEDTLYATVTSFKDFAITIKRRAGATVQYRTRVVAVGGKSSGNANSSTLAAGSGDLAPDTTVPGTPSAPDVQEYFGEFQVTASAPATGITTLLEYQYVMSFSSFAPIGDPTVGLEGVQKIKKSGGGVSFRRSISTAAMFFYVRCRNSSIPGSWSAWSAGTLISVLRRPIDDEVDPGIPVLSTAGDIGWDGFNDLGGLGVSGGTCLVVTEIVGGSRDFMIQFLTPIANSHSLETIQLEVYKQSNQVLKLSIKLKGGVEISHHLNMGNSSFTPVFRCRMRNKFRGSGSNGWSDWSRFTIGAATIKPDGSGWNSQLEGDPDIYDEGNRPTIYSGF